MSAESQTVHRWRRRNLHIAAAAVALALAAAACGGTSAPKSGAVTTTTVSPADVCATKLGGLIAQTMDDKYDLIGRTYGSDSAVVKWMLANRVYSVVGQEQRASTPVTTTGLSTTTL
jgi:hypothetical protein